VTDCSPRDLSEAMIAPTDIGWHDDQAEFRHQTVEQTRLLFFSMIGAIFTSASPAFAAVRL
jgi:hypothetical protein